MLLNKADTIDTQQLMRVYGALMWSLGKVMQTPEVCRVYIGSFWEAPLCNFENRFLLEVREACVRVLWRGGVTRRCSFCAPSCFFFVLCCVWSVNNLTGFWSLCHCNCFFAIGSYVVISW